MPNWTPEELAEYERRKNKLATGNLDSGKGAIVQPDARPPLDARLQGAKPAKKRDTRRANHGRPILRVTLVAFTRRALDGDNLAAGCKQIRDGLAERFGLDDSERNFEWNYASVATRGRCGVIVTIEAI